MTEESDKPVTSAFAPRLTEPGASPDWEIMVVAPRHASADAAGLTEVLHAGGLAIVDLGWDGAAVPAGLDAVLTHDRGGLRVDAMHAGLDPSGLPEVGVLVVAGDPDEVDSWRPVARRLIAEVTDVAGARRAAKAGADGVVVRANEAGGRVSTSGAFLLLQQMADFELPFWVAGATGVDAAGAHRLAQAAGVVLAEELWGLWPGPGDERLARLVAAADGTETRLVDRREGSLRISGIHARADHTRLELADTGEFAAMLRGEGMAEPPVALGQGVAFAGPLAARYGSLTSTLHAYREVSLDGVAEAARSAVFGVGSRLAIEHGTRYPIVQGPMTRVSDVAAFASEVATTGALPFVALSLMSGEAASELMAETAEIVGDRPWGAGMLGFAPSELRSAQIEAVLAAEPDFAIIAGGRPAQARELEEHGIRTYLHVPSPGLLTTFLAEGARRFIFEGRECGGHIGPRASLALWQQMVDVIVDADLSDPEALCVLLAGGIHDARSSAMAQAVVAPLMRRGVAVGALMGTGYMFTPEAVAAGAITEDFQARALECESTSLLTTAPGHQTRCATTPYAEEFDGRRRAMLAAGRDGKEIWAELEVLNTGRLRIASKGLRRSSDVGDAAAGGIEGLAADLGSFDEEVVVEITNRGGLVEVDPETRRREGLYMLGEVAMLRHDVQPMAELHRSVAEGSITVLRAEATDRRLDAVALVGLSANYPTARDLREFWSMVVEGRSAVREVTPDRWDPGIFFAPDRQGEHTVYSKWGSFLDPLRFDPMAYRIPPRAAVDASPEQLYALDAASTALDSAEARGLGLSRARTAVLVGAASFGVGVQYFIRPVLQGVSTEVVSADLSAEVLRSLDPHLPRWSEDVFPGMLTNVIAGRIANRLDLHGANATVDAACAASLASMEMAVNQLRSGRADAVIAGGIDCTNAIGGFIAFARTHALTPTGVSRPFDATADGIVLGEGVGMVAMKRLTDAVRDGNDIEAVLLGIGASSDGQSKSLTAPYPAGQRMAVERAYADASVRPDSVALIEAHGTGTAAGDSSEIESLGLVFGIDRGAGTVSLGSVKSNIGHAKTAAGVAGLTKVALSLRNRLLPPTINVTEPNAALADTPFVVHSGRRPWIRTPRRPVRRGAQSAFGFGGTNFHVVLEEYDHPDPARFRDLAPRPVELFTWSAPSRADLRSRLADFGRVLDDLCDVSLAQIARSVNVDDVDGPSGLVRLGIVANSHEDLREKVEAAFAALASDVADLPRNLHLGEGTGVGGEQVAFLYPGQGAQYLGMFGDLATSFPFAVPWIEAVDAVVDGISPLSISDAVYPPPSLDRSEVRDQRRRLDDTRMAQPAIGTMNILAHEILGVFGITPARVAGHSYGEIAASILAGFLTPHDGMRFSARRGLAANVAAEQTPGGMASVSASAEIVQAALDDLGRENVFVATMNAPNNTVIAGAEAELVATIDDLNERELTTRRVPVTAPFHTPLVSVTIEMAQTELADLDCFELDHPVYSNETAEPMDPSPEAVRETIAHMTCAPVRFVDIVENMHRDGARVFIEAGPNRILTNLVGRILADVDHVALNVDDKTKSAFIPFADLLASLHALGLASL
ncbi:MAG: beta-ketoacyl synthase N-terminal-like domain-containing protein, partial [Acidimicrobiales bacterium]